MKIVEVHFKQAEGEFTARGYNYLLSNHSIKAGDKPYYIKVLDELQLIEGDSPARTVLVRAIFNDIETVEEAKNDYRVTKMMRIDDDSKKVYVYPISRRVESTLQKRVRKARKNGKLKENPVKYIQGNLFYDSID